MIGCRALSPSYFTDSGLKTLRVRARLHVQHLGQE